MKKFRNCAAALLVLLMLMSAACSSGQQQETETTAAEITTEATVPTFEIGSGYVVIRPDLENETEIAAMQLVRRCIKQVYGINLNCATDWVKRDAEVKPGEYEILIGGTNRSDSIELTESLSGSEGAYQVISENVIVIAGGSPDATLAAAQAFVRDIYGYEETDTQRVVSEGAPKALTASEPVKVGVSFPKVLLNGTDLREYRLVSERFNNATTAFNVRIQALCGEKMKEISPDEYKDGPAVFLGMLPDPMSIHTHSEGPFDSYTYYTVTEGDRIAVDYISSGLDSKVLTSFAEMFFPETGIGIIEITVPEGRMSHIALPGEVNGLVRESTEEREIASGVVYTEVLYKDRNGAPVRAYALTVAPGSARLYAGTPNDAAPVNGVVSTVMNEMNAAVKNGKNVIAGVNAGFFDMGGTGLSRGLCVKDGALMQALTERPFVAVLKDGSIRIMTSNDYSANAQEIYNAVAGNVILLKDGKILNVAPGTEMAVTRHPRTAVGIRPDGTVVVLEVDGRQPKLSNGASYCDLVCIFREFGCTEALNLDGGGSSTFIIKDTDGTFRLQNSPSDGSMRKVQDSLLIVLPEKN